MRILLLLPLALTATACVSAKADPPSLGARPIEGVLDRPTRGIAPVASADDPALAGQIAEIVAQAESGDSEFQAALPAARRAVESARGAPAESESWIVAQLQLSVLGGKRSKTTTALGALDEIFGGQAIAGAPADTAALEAARTRVGALYRGQAEAYDALAEQLRNR